MKNSVSISFDPISQNVSRTSNTQSSVLHNADELQALPNPKKNLRQRSSLVLKQGLRTWSRMSSHFTSNENNDFENSNDDESFTGGLSASSINSSVEYFGGTLVFRSTTSDDLKQDYLMVGKDMLIEDLGRFINRTWKLRAPDIVLSVISNSDYFDEGIDSDVEDFQIGIIQAARLTKMWILTEGINAGIPRIIGEAIAQERVKRKTIEKDISRSISRPIVVIGIVGSDDLWYGEAIERATEPMDRFGKCVLENNGDDNHELNPQHTHFLIMNNLDRDDKDVKWNTRFLIESKLVQHITSRRSRSKEWITKYQSPVVGLLVKGGPKEIERVLWLLRKQIPVIVIKKKGYASGLVAYAYSEGLKGGDSQHLENIVKPQLLQQMVEAFPDEFKDNDLGRMNCRDKILECVKHAVQGECRYITVLDPSLHGVDLKDLNKFILTAIFNAQRETYLINTRENINKYLRLTVDWNSPEFARKEIVSKLERMRFRVKDDLFMEALLQPDREQFVELFLKMGFVLRNFLSESRLLYLYEESLDNDFFVHLCLERILHRTPHSLGKHFLEGTNCRLNYILLSLTGLKGLVNPKRLSMGKIEGKQQENDEAERKALLALIYWAVLTNRKPMAKLLWKRTSEPIAVALVISNIYYHISHNWIQDVDLKNTVKQSAIEFGALAVEMMDLVFSDSSLMAYYSLVNPLSDFNNLNVVDLALIGNNIFFIAHPCCQRSMRARWLGRIKIKSFAWGFVNFPENLKIYLCLFLIFPIYFWMTFNPEKHRQVPVDDDDDPDDTESDERSQEDDYIRNNRRYGKNDPYRSLPLWRKLYYLWTAPISKFWFNQLFIMAYLVLFALALLIPYCGNKYLNLILCGWTAIHLIELVLATFRTKSKYPTFNLFWSILAILADIYIFGVTGMLVIQQFYHQHPTFVNLFLDYSTYKFLMSLGVLWVYFRSLQYILPVSQDLGPMYVNISQLTRRDLINWFKLFMVCLVSGGIAIQAVVYPAQPLTDTNFWHHQLRAALGIFLSEVDDLTGDASCSPLYDVPEIAYTCNASTIQPYIRARLENCPYAHLTGYIVVIQQLLITRHVFYILMFAMFSVTTNRTRDRSVEIWKFQFYVIVADFEQRSNLPVPLSPLTYPFKITFYTIKYLFLCILKFKCCTFLRNKFTRNDTDSYGIPHHHWKYYMTIMTKKEEEKESHIQDILGQLEEDSAVHTVMAKRLAERVVSVERSQTLAGFYLESIITKLEDIDSKTPAHRGQLRSVHTASRSSPYPGTTIYRFPVLEKDVSWDVKFESYDPSTYTKPVEEFPQDLQMWIDRDILKLPTQFEEISTVEASTFLTYASPTDPEFNTIQTIKLVDGKEFAINRVSSMRVGDSNFVYEHEAPKLNLIVQSDDYIRSFQFSQVFHSGDMGNPNGRTGLRGRGNLWRWGPNHGIQAVISRMRSDTSTNQTSNTVSTFSNKHLEILVLHDNIDLNTINLPGARVQYGVTPYSTMCNYIMKDILQDSEEELFVDSDQDEMIEFLSRFATVDFKKKKKSMFTTLGFSAFLVFNGYGDDSANTDNAWKETEIWNFHYKYKNSFDNFLKDNYSYSWMPMSVTIALPPSEYIAVVESAKIHDVHH